MTFNLNILPRAERDAEHIFQWIRRRSPEGAIHWWLAFEAATEKLTRHPEGYSLALEQFGGDEAIRQFLFKTRRGRTYRGLFTVVGREIRLLRIRGPGQPPLGEDELE